MKNYFAFGLHIKTEIDLPELYPSDRGDDIIVKYGNVPVKLSNPLKKGVRYEAAKDEFLLTVDGVAKYYVTHGKQITVEPFKNSDPPSIRLFLLGSAFGALIFQRNLVPLHASAIRNDDYAVLFSGSSGVGKSTLAAGFHKKGYKIIDDDICVVNLIDNIPYIVPGYPQIKLWADVLKRMEENPEKYHKIRNNIEKFGLKVHDNFEKEELPLKHLFILQIKNSEGFETDEVRGIEKFNILRKNTYRFQFIDGLSKQKEHFVTLEKIAQQTKIIRIKRPKSVFLLDELIEIILEQL